MLIIGKTGTRSQEGAPPQPKRTAVAVKVISTSGMA